jgi:hypothetical protein
VKRDSAEWSDPSTSYAQPPASRTSRTPAITSHGKHQRRIQATGGQPREMQSCRAMNSDPKSVDGKSPHQFKMQSILLSRLGADREVREPHHRLVEPVHVVHRDASSVEESAGSLQRQIPLAEEREVMRGAGVRP